MHDIDLAYLAGVIDCDGFITIARARKANKGKCKPNTYHCLKVGISGTRRAPHDLAQSLFGGNVSSYTPKNKNHRVQYQWTSSGPTALAFIHAIAPYLRIKVAQAELGVQFQELLKSQCAERYETQKPPYHITPSMRNMREKLCARMQGLNQSRRRKKKQS